MVAVAHSLVTVAHSLVTAVAHSLVTAAAHSLVTAVVLALVTADHMMVWILLRFLEVEMFVHDLMALQH